MEPTVLEGMTEQGHRAKFTEILQGHSNWMSAADKPESANVLGKRREFGLMTKGYGTNISQTIGWQVIRQSGISDELFGTILSKMGKVQQMTEGAEWGKSVARHWGVNDSPMADFGYSYRRLAGKSPNGRPRSGFDALVKVSRDAGFRASENFTQRKSKRNDGRDTANG